MGMEKLYLQYVSNKTGFQHLDLAVLMLKMHHVLEGQLKLIKTQSRV